MILPTQAMVLAAGRGSRLRPLTDTLPKPMVEVGGRTLIDRALDRLEAARVTKIVVNGSYKADMLKAHLLQRATLPLLFSYEDTALETGGGIAYALHHFNNDLFFCVNGDIVWLDGEIPALTRLASHWSEEIDALLLLQPLEKAIGYDGKGDFFIRQDGVLSRRGSELKAPYVYGGVQLLHPRLFHNCPKGAFSLNELYDKALNAQRIRGLVHDDAWLHVGDMEGKAKAETYLFHHGIAGS